MSQAVRKPCFFGLNPLTCGYVAAGVFFPGKKGSIFLEALNLWVHCCRRFFLFQDKRPLYFWKPLACGYVAAGAFFSSQKGPHFLEALDLWVRCRRRFFFRQKTGPIFFGTDPPDLGTDHEGTARKYLARHGIIRARHGNIWHGTDPPDLGTARHGTSL